MNAPSSLFISHGSPMHALDRGAATQAWEQLGQTLPRPRAILVMSAHWETRQPMLTGTLQPETIHDFVGFPEELYRIRYAAPGDPALALRAKELLADAGFAAAIDGLRGLDHGAWSPLLHMYPQADIPVMQLAVQTALGPQHHYALGRALGSLAGDGVLLIGSGHMTHNLRDWMLQMRDPQPASYALEFQSWVRQRLIRGEHDQLIDYRHQAPHAARAHPTEEHFLPLLFALGAAGREAAAECIYDGIDGHVLAMDAWLFRPR
ncbi:MAG: 4,5-DOPA dioxygenase extradiol [Burkholderiaceae bacterium]|nr:4,5-DOPA dioxygenase extradiol [Burkholderiaceae bacterium]